MSCRQTFPRDLRGPLELFREGAYSIGTSDVDHGHFIVFFVREWDRHNHRKGVMSRGIRARLLWSQTHKEPGSSSKAGWSSCVLEDQSSGLSVYLYPCSVS